MCPDPLPGSFGRANPQEGICETGAMASFLAAGTAYANFAVPTIPFYIFYSIFGFQRVGDMIWAAGDAMARASCWGAPPGAPP